MGRRDCRGFFQYRCVDGNCVSEPSYCMSTRTSKCYDDDLPYYCPDDNTCAKNDVYCTRPCGTRNSVYTYKYECAGYKRCSFTNWQSCPPQCDRYRCADNRCVDESKQCGMPCSGWICDNGQCLDNSAYRCDNVLNCADGSDENGCPSFDGQTGYIPSLWIGLSMTMIVAFLVVVFCTIFWCRRSKSTSARRANRIRRNVVIQSGIQPGDLPAPDPCFHVPQPYTQYGINDTRPFHDMYRGPDVAPCLGVNNAPPPYAPPISAYAPPNAPYISSAIPTEPPSYGERGHWDAPPQYNDVVNAGYSGSRPSVYRACE